MEFFLSKIEVINDDVQYERSESYRYKDRINELELKLRERECISGKRCVRTSRSLSDVWLGWCGTSRGWRISTGRRDGFLMA